MIKSKYIASLVRPLLWQMSFGLGFNVHLAPSIHRLCMFKPFLSNSKKKCFQENFALLCMLTLYDTSTKSIQLMVSKHSYEGDGRGAVVQAFSNPKPGFPFLLFCFCPRHE